MSYSWKSRDECGDEKSQKNELDTTKSITTPNNNMKTEEKYTFSEKIESKDQINTKSTTINNYEKNSGTSSSSNVKSKPNKKKRKKQKEEKEDGELDDENESMEESQHDENHEYEDDDYEDYDMDDDSHEDLNKKSDTADSSVPKSTDPTIDSEKSSTINTVATTIITKAEDLKDFNQNLKLTVTTNPSEITFNPNTDTSSTSCSSIRASTNVPVVSGNTIQYDLEEEDDDDDDDDEYGNSKRLKIDEESEIVDEKPSESKQTDNLVEQEAKISHEIQPITITKNEEEPNTKLDNLNDASSSNKNSSLLEQHQQSNQIYSGNNSNSKQIDLDNDNDSSSSMSSKSSVSTSSALTAISAISSDSLPISSTSSITYDSKPMTSNKYETANSEINQQHESNGENVESSSSENNSNIKKPEDSKSGQQKPTAIDLQSIESLKVPPLKIIYSNSHGGHPYVKSDSNEGKTRNKKSKKESNDTSSGSDTQTKTEDDTSNQASKSQSESDTPASNSRFKASKTTISANNRVGSPVTTALIGNITTKTTPTRRSAAASALAGRSSPAQNSFASLNQQNTKKTSDSNTSTNNSSTASNQSAVNDNNSNNGSNMVNSNEMENVIRRKLRSHTRQLQTGDVFEHIVRSQLNTITKSPSPLTILSENANNFNTTEPYGVEPQQAVSSNQQPSENNKGSDHSNDSQIDSSDSATNNGTGNQDSAQPARKKRNRQQAQSENLTTSSAANDSSEATQSYSLSHQTNSEAIASCNSSIDSTASINSNLTLVNQAGNSQLATGEQPTISATNTHSTQQPSVVYNCIRQFLDLRNEIAKKRDTSMEIRYDVKMPKNYQDFTLFKKNYLIKSNKEVRQSISFFKPPNDMPDDLKEYFFKQEKDRHSLRLRHRIEQDKLIILYEQEILRSFNNRCGSQVTANRSNQSIPYSFCSIVKDDEVYSVFGRLNEQIIGSNSDQQQQHHQQQQQNQNDQCVLLRLDSQNTEEKFLQNLENLKIKFQKLKENLVKRQLNESDSLQAVQKMDFQACIRELLNKYKTAATASVKNPTNSTIANTNSSLANYNLISQFQQTNIANCVPIVHVNFNKIDLFDVSQVYSPSNSSNAAVSVSS